MASKVIAEMAVRLGMDPGEFLDRIKGVQGVTAFTSAQMARDMRRGSREAGESFRLIDESLGIHVSRPLTKILVSEFPQFGKVLQSVLGGAVFGAVATIGVEAFEKLGKAIAHAREAQEQFRDATLRVRDVGINAADSWALKIASLRGTGRFLLVEAG